MRDAVSLEAAWQVPDAAVFFRNVWPLYLHDLCGVGLRFFRLDDLGRWQPDIVGDWVNPVTAPGLLREPRAADDPGQPYQRAYVIKSGERRCGFVCVGLAPFRHMPPDADCMVAETYVVPDVRGTGLAAEGVKQALALHDGRWVLEALVGNGRAVAFWRKTLPRLGLADLVEAREPTGIAWRFRR